MPKNILQDMRVRDRSGSGETVITITRKDYVPRESRQEVIEVIDDPVQDIEIPGEIDVEDSGENNIRRVHTVPSRSVAVDDEEEEISGEDLPPVKNRLLRSILPRPHSSRQSTGGLPVVAQGIRATHDMKRPVVEAVEANVSEDEELTDTGEPSKPTTPRIPFTFSFKMPSRKVLLGILASLVLILFVYWLTTFFEKAIVTIVPKNKVLTMDRQQFSALRDGPAQGIDFEVMIFSDKETKNMTLTNSENMSTKARGEITFYNEYSTKPQGIVAGTYVADGSGKAYRTDSQVSIPGYTTRNGSVIPGQVTVKITSFLPGEAYNKTTNTFTINSFKKDPIKFKKIYGKLKTPLSGGVEGLVYVLSDAEKATVNAYTQTTFKNTILKKALAQVPEGYVLFPNAFDFTSTTNENITSKTPTTGVVISGTISAVILKEKDIATALIKRGLPKVSASELSQISLTDLSKLEFAFVNHNQAIAKNTVSVTFTLSGPVQALWAPMVTQLPERLKGVLKDKVFTVFSSDPGIASASVKIFPPWQSHLPYSTNKIKVEIK